MNIMPRTVGALRCVKEFTSDTFLSETISKY